MINWRTQIQLDSQEISISHQDSSIFLGSCFSENIANKFRLFGLRAQNNPLGIIYNPVSILKQLRLLLDFEAFDESRIIQRQNVFFHLDAHSDIHATSKDQLHKRWINQKIEFQKFWAKAKFLFITLGTSWVYEYQNTQKIVANCHKIPAKEFSKRILSIQEIIDSLHEIIQLSQHENSTKRIIFTVSPVRHLRDGFVNNSRSKAQLLSAVHTVIENNQSEYFPSYEMMMDDLRDYRYYTDDMVHPSEQAIEYIWEKLKNLYFDIPTINIGEEVIKLRKMCAHRPLFPESDEHQLFIKSVDKKIEDFHQKHKDMKFIKFR